MLHILVNNKFIDALSCCILSVGIYLMLPPFFVLKCILKLFNNRSRENNMKGKVVLITGASSGIGECMAYEYARKQAYLVIVARREKQLRKVAEKAREIGSPDVLFVCADVSKFNDCKRFVDEAILHFGRLDHLVNNAGIANMYAVNEGTDVTKFQPLMDINFWGSVYASYHAIPHLKTSKGKIVLNSSCAGYFNPPRTAFYNASKAALASFYDSLRDELAPEITITISTLGFVESEMTLGKIMSMDGHMENNEQVKDVIYNSFPVMNTEICAKTIVQGACRGERYVMLPQCMRPLIFLKVFFPELVEWYMRMYYRPKVASEWNNLEVQS